MRYVYVRRMIDGETWVQEFDNLDEALDYGDYEWRHMKWVDKIKAVKTYLLESANPDEKSKDHFDGHVLRIYK